MGSKIEKGGEKKKKRFERRKRIYFCKCLMRMVFVC